MKMSRLLKYQFPDIRLSLLATVLVTGKIPPESLRTHINQAVRVPDTNRIGHGINITHEGDADDLLQLIDRNRLNPRIIIPGIHDFDLYT